MPCTPPRLRDFGRILEGYSNKIFGHGWALAQPWIHIYMSCQFSSCMADVQLLFFGFKQC
eukprot:190998-Karenia_brevis.AAC.1